jgi:hypothetical protein
VIKVSAGSLKAWISSVALFSSGRTLFERSGGYVLVYLATPSLEMEA